MLYIYVKLVRVVGKALSLKKDCIIRKNCTITTKHHGDQDMVPSTPTAQTFLKLNRSPTPVRSKQKLLKPPNTFLFESTYNSIKVVLNVLFATPNAQIGDKWQYLRCSR